MIGVRSRTAFVIAAGRGTCAAPAGHDIGSQIGALPENVARLQRRRSPRERSRWTQVKKERIDWRGACRSASRRWMPSVRWRSRAGGQEKRAAVNRSYAARFQHNIALRRALDDKLAKQRHEE